MSSSDNKADEASSREDPGPAIFLPSENIHRYTGAAKDLAKRLLHSQDQDMQLIRQVTVTTPSSDPATSNPEALEALFKMVYLREVQGLFIPLRGNKDLYCSAMGSYQFPDIKKLHIQFDPQQKPSFRKAIDDVEALLQDRTRDRERFPELEELHMSGIDESAFRGIKYRTDVKGREMAAKFCNLLRRSSSTPATRLCKIFESGYTEAGFIDYLETQAVARMQPTGTEEEEEGILMLWSSKAPGSVLVNSCMLLPAARNK